MAPAGPLRYRVVNGHMDELDPDEDALLLALLADDERLRGVERARRRDFLSPLPPPERRCTRACPLGHSMIVEMGAKSGWCDDCRSYRLTGC